VNGARSARRAVTHLRRGDPPSAVSHIYERAVLVSRRVTMAPFW